MVNLYKSDEDIIYEQDYLILRLRRALIKAGRNTGAYIADEVSNDFIISHVPNEIALKIQSLNETIKQLKGEDGYLL